MLKHVDLCSGIGGFALGFEWAGLSRPVLFCDIEPWSRKILAKHWPDVPIEEDVKVLANDPNGLVPDCDILTAGYPCQPFSVAGKRRGEEDDRHIWPEIFRIIKAKRPTWCVFENVYGHVALGLDQVLADLEAEGYACRTFIVPACGVDAPHRRDRLWIVGHTTDNGRNRGATQTGRKGAKGQSDQSELGVRGKSGRPSEDVADAQRQRQILREHEGRPRHKKGLSPGRGGDVADTDSIRLEEYAHGKPDNAGQSPRCRKHEGWHFEPNVGRVANGIPRRVDRLKGLGNAIVQQIAMQIGIVIRQCEVGALPSVESVDGS